MYSRTLVSGIPYLTCCTSSTFEIALDPTYAPNLDRRAAAHVLDQLGGGPRSRLRKAVVAGGSVFPAVASVALAKLRQPAAPKEEEEEAVLMASKAAKPRQRKRSNGFRAVPAPPNRNSRRNVPIRAPVVQTLGARQATVQGDLVVSRREFFHDVVQVEDPFAAVNSIKLKPSLWPWCGSFANMYESFTLEYFAVEFVPSVSTATSGYVALAIDYDPDDDLPKNKPELLNMKGAVAGPAWKGLKVVAPRRDMQKRAPYYTGGYSELASQRQVSAGHVVFATGGGSTAGALLGEVWIEYRVRFQTPQLANPYSLDSLENYGAATATGSANSAPFGSSLSEGSLPATFTSSDTTASLTVFTFSAAWSGLIAVEIAGTTLSGMSTSASTGVATNLIAQTLADASAQTAVWMFTADPGETFSLTINNAAISKGEIYFMRGPKVTAL